MSGSSGIASLKKSPLATAADDAERLAAKLAKDPEIQQPGPAHLRLPRPAGQPGLHRVVQRREGPRRGPGPRLAAQAGRPAHGPEAADGSHRPDDRPGGHADRPERHQGQLPGLRRGPERSCPLRRSSRSGTRMTIRPSPARISGPGPLLSHPGIPSLAMSTFDQRISRLHPGPGLAQPQEMPRDGRADPAALGAKPAARAAESPLARRFPDRARGRRERRHLRRQRPQEGDRAGPRPGPLGPRRRLGPDRRRPERGARGTFRPLRRRALRRRGQQPQAARGPGRRPRRPPRRGVPSAPWPSPTRPARSGSRPREPAAAGSSASPAAPRASATTRSS